MKNRTLLSILLTICLGALALQPAVADPAGYIDVPLGTNVLTLNGATTNSTVATTSFYLPDRGVYVASGLFKIPQNSQLVIMPDFAGNSAGTSNVVFTFNFGVEQNVSNLSTTGPLAVTVAQTGSTRVVGYQQINWTNLTGATWGQLTSVGTTSLNTNTLNRVRIGFKNVTATGN